MPGALWLEDHILTARQAWRAGLSAREIGNQIGRTRNAVLGKLYRLELMRAGPIKRCGGNFLQKQRTAAPAQKKVATVAARSSAAPPALNVPFSERKAGQCRAITDSTRWEQKCCAHPTDERGIYCAYHAELHIGRSRKRGR